MSDAERIRYWVEGSTLSYYRHQYWGSNDAQHNRRILAVVNPTLKGTRWKAYRYDYSSDRLVIPLPPQHGFKTVDEAKQYVVALDRMGELK